MCSWAGHLTSLFPPAMEVSLHGASGRNLSRQGFFFSFFFSVAYGGSQVRGLIGAIAAGLRQSHSNTGSEPRLQPTPQLMATSDP